MKKSTMDLLALMAKVACRITRETDLDCSIGSNGTLVLWGWRIAPEEHWWGSLQGKPVLDSEGPITGLEHGLSRRYIEKYLTLNGVENAIFRAIANKAGISVPVADWYRFNH